MPGIEWVATLNNDHFIKSQKQIQDSITQTAKQVEASGMSIDKYMESLKNKAAALAAGFSLQQFTSQMVRVRGEFQQLEVAFKTMLGNAEKADALMAQLTKTAAITPFDLQGVTNGAKQLLAYGISADEVNDKLIHLGDIAAGLSLPLNDLVYLYGTTMTQGRMFTQDLRQFQGRGIPIAEELAKVFGVTKDKVGELVTAGKVGAKEFNQAIMAMSSEGGKFAGLMEAQSKTITGQISNIEDAIDVMFNDLGKQSEGIINGTLGVISSLVENYQKVGEVIMGLATTYGTYKTAVMVVTALQGLQTAGVGALTAAETVHYGWLVVTEKAQALLNKTMLANPYVLVATAVAGLVAIMVTMKSEQDRVNEAYDEYNQKKADIIKKEEEHKARIEELARVAGDESLSTDTRRLALVELEQKYPAIFAKYDTEAEKLKHIRDLKAEIAALDSKGSITKASNELDRVEKRIKELEAIHTDSFINSAGGRTYTGRNRNDREEDELKALQRRRSELSNQIKKDEGNNYLTNLTGVSNADLKKQIDERRNLIAKMDVSGKKYGKVNSGGATGVYNKDELQGQLQILEAEQNRRKKVLEDSAKDFAAEANKAYKKEQDVLRKLKSLTDPKKRAKSTQTIDGKKVSEMSGDEFLAAIEKQQAAVAEAKKKVDTYKVKGDGKAGADAAAKSLQERWKQEEELSDMEQKARRAREDASIAAIKNQAERERAEREAQHRRTLEDLKEQEDDIYKKIYQQRKTAYENANKGLKYENTSIGSEGWVGTKRQATAQVVSIADATGKERAVLVTPTLPDGTELTQKQLDKYINDVLKGSKDFKEDPDKQIILGIDVEADAAKKLTTDTEKALVKNQREITKADIDKANTEESRRQLEEQKQRIQSMRDFLKEYGDFEERRLAITQKYADLIAEAEAANDPYKAAMLEEQRDKEVSSQRLADIKETMDWEGLFNNLDRYSVDFLNSIRGRLAALLQDSTLNPEDAQVLAEQLAKVDEMLTSKGGGLFHGFFPSLERQKRLEDEARQAVDDYNESLRQQREAEKELANARGKQMVAQGEVTGLQLQIAGLLGLDYRKAGEITAENADDYLNAVNLDENSEAAKRLTEAFERLAEAQKKLTESTKETEKADAKAKTKKSKTEKSKAKAEQKEDEASKKLSERLKEFFGDLGNILNEILSPLDGLLNNIGAGDFADEINKIKEKVGMGLQGVESGGAALTAFASGNYLQAATEGLSAIGSFAGALGLDDLFGGGVSDENYEEDMQRLTDSNNRLIESIDRLSDKMDDQGISDKFETYEQQLKNWEQLEKNTQEMLSRTLGVYDSGGMFSGDTDSAGKSIYNWLKDDEENWQRLRDAIGDQTKFREDNWAPMGSYGERGTRSHRAEELGTLTAEEMWKIRENDPALWEKILEGASRGYEDASEYLNAMADLWEKGKELQENFLTSVTTVSFDSLKDSFADALMSMEEDARDTSENISKTMSQALINSMVNDEYAEKLKKWREELAEVLDIEDVSERNRRLAELKEQYQGYMDAAAKEADAIKEATGYTAAVKEKEKQQQQSATSKGIENITQEQASALEGLATAQLIVQEQIKAILERNDSDISKWQERSDDELARKDGDLARSDDDLAIWKKGFQDAMTNALPVMNGLDLSAGGLIGDMSEQLNYRDAATSDFLNMQQELILQNLQTLQASFTGTFDEIRTLTIQANSTRETMLKVMKEHFANFTTQMNKVIKTIQEQ